MKYQPSLEIDGGSPFSSEQVVPVPEQHPTFIMINLFLVILLSGPISHREIGLAGASFALVCCGALRLVQSLAIACNGELNVRSKMSITQSALMEFFAPELSLSQRLGQSPSSSISAARVSNTTNQIILRIVSTPEYVIL